MGIALTLVFGTNDPPSYVDDAHMMMNNLKLMNARIIEEK